jgi:hypothetical protein
VVPLCALLTFEALGRYPEWGAAEPVRPRRTAEGTDRGR